MTDPEHLRDQLVTANRILANEGIIQGFGHVSVRLPESDAMLISVSRSPAFVTREDIIKTDFDGNVLDDREGRLYKETVIHRAIYRDRNDVDAVVHHHAPPVMPFTVTDRELQPVFHMAALFHDGVPTFRDYDPECGRLVVTEDEGERMAAVLSDHRAQLLEGHGANVTGGSLKETIIATVYFVMNAQYQFQALQIGDPEYFTGSKQMVDNTINDVILQPIAMDRMWEYLCKQLPETDRVFDYTQGQK